MIKKMFVLLTSYGKNVPFLIQVVVQFESSIAIGFTEKNEINIFMGVSSLNFLELEILFR